MVVPHCGAAAMLHTRKAADKKVSRGGDSLRSCIQ